MSKIKVGVIGTGNMGANHVRIYKALPHLCDISGIFDEDAQVCNRVAAQFHVKAFATRKALWDNVDAVSIAVPSTSHFAVAQEALEKGIHVLLEKPIAETVEQGSNLVKTAKEKNRILQVGHVERFNPAILLLPEIVNGKQIIALDFRRLSPYNPRIKDADVVADLMIHDIDVLRFLLPGSIAKIAAVGSSPMSATHADYAVATILLEGGIIASLTASRVTEQKIRTLCITTAESFIELDYIDRRIFITRATHLGFEAVASYRQESIIEKVFVPNQEPLMLEIESFLRCVENGSKPFIDGEDGVKALEIVQRVQQCIYPFQYAKQETNYGNH